MPLRYRWQRKCKHALGFLTLNFIIFCSPDAVYHAYKDLFNYLGKPFPKELEEKYQHALATVAEAKRR